MNGGTHRIVVSRTPGGCSFVYKTSSFFYLLRVTESRIKFTKTCFFLEICFLGNIQNRVWCFNSKIFWCVCMYVFGVVGEFWYWKEEGSEFFFLIKLCFLGCCSLNFWQTRVRGQCEFIVHLGQVSICPSSPMSCR